MLERANISRYCLAKYSKEEPLTPVAITTFDGGAAPQCPLMTQSGDVTNGTILDQKM
jgi:hypothetical protein